MTKTFDERFALEVLGGEGVLVEFDRGVVLLLNGSATQIWQLFRAGHDVETCAEKLAAMHFLPLGAAQRDVAAALETGRVPVPAPSTDPFHYERVGDRYVVSRSGERILESTPDGCTVRVCAPRPVSSHELCPMLISLAPKLLALQGVRVLHASAVAIRGQVLAISGRSGAGKTTTARALIAAGAQRIAEDKLVLGSGGRTVMCQGEHRIHDWAKTTAKLLAVEASEDRDCRSLRECEHGPSAPLVSIAMVDASWRCAGSARFAASHMTRAEATAAVLLQTFVGTTAPAIWRANLAHACALATAVPILRFAAPDGLDALEDAARAYVSNSTS